MLLLLAFFGLCERWRSAKWAGHYGGWMSKDLMVFFYLNFYIGVIVFVPRSLVHKLSFVSKYVVIVLLCNELYAERLSFSLFGSHSFFCAFIWKMNKRKESFQWNGSALIKIFHINKKKNMKIWESWFLEILSENKYRISIETAKQNTVYMTQ